MLRLDVQDDRNRARPLLKSYSAKSERLRSYHSCGRHDHRLVRERSPQRQTVERPDQAAAQLLSIPSCGEIGHPGEP